MIFGIGIGVVNGIVNGHWYCVWCVIGIINGMVFGISEVYNYNLFYSVCNLYVIIYKPS